MNAEFVELERPTTKTLVVYACGSMYRFDNLFRDHLWEIDKDGMLLVMNVNRCTGEHEVAAYFRAWDYFFIEKQ